MNESGILEHIPTHLIAGPLGSGKTTLLKNLMRQRPPDERWAILINEFGQVGIDAALLETGDSGIQLAEIPGGCLCCVNGVPFQIGLGRLLRRARPQRLFIEASGLGHPDALMQQLKQAPWQGVLNVQPLIMVLDAPRLVAGYELAEAQQQSLDTAGLVILNKTEHLTQAQCSQLANRFHPTLVAYSSQACLELKQLPSAESTGNPEQFLMLPEGQLPAGELWWNPNDWHCHEQQQGLERSIGWKISPGQIFDLAAVRDWLQDFCWQRAKGVLHTDQGWLAFNGLGGEDTDWRPSEWRRDNRLELITVASGKCPMPAVQELESALRATLINPPVHDPESCR